MDQTDSPWSGRLTLDPGMVVYQGPGGHAGVHSHHAIQLIRSFDSSVTLEMDGGSTEVDVALIPSGVEHAFRSDSRCLLLALIEPLGPRGSQLQDLAEDSIGRDLTPMIERSTISPEIAGVELGRHLIDRLLPPAPAPRPLSQHVQAALHHLDLNLVERPTLGAAAEAAHISESRLTHLFTDEVGIPFRSYVLWLRLRQIAAGVASGSNLTEAAIDAGFSDSSHLSRVFKENFGLTPSALLRMKVSDAEWPS